MAVLDFEKIKAEGLEVDFLKYTQEGFEAVRPDDYYRLKTYGLCTQRHEGYFMMRIRIPGGVIDADQMDRIASLAERFGQGWGHLTTRGNIELHSVKVDDFLNIVEELKEVGITTRSSCGHTFRNILGCHQNGVCAKEPFDLQPWIRKVHDHVFEKAEVYNQRLPRRLNVSFSGCADCSADAHINDIGFVSKKIEKDGEIHLGFELWVAGSLGTSPRLSYPLKDFVPFDEVLPSLQAITEIYCLNGERKNASRARLKFLLEKWGIEKFRSEFEILVGRFKQAQAPLPPELAHPKWFDRADVSENHSGIEGVYPQPQKGFYRIQFWVPLGEMTADQMKKTAVFSRRFADGKCYHTTRQNMEFHWVKKEDLFVVLQEMEKLGFSPENSDSILNVVSCPGTSFCSLAVTSSQGAAKVLMKEFRALALDTDPTLRDIKVNISGCPNSCAKHQVADIGFSGGMTEIAGIRRFGYQLYLGGKFNGEVRAGSLVKKGIPDDLVLPTARSVIEVFKEKRFSDERFSDFVDRVGVQMLTSLLDQRLLTQKRVLVETPVIMSPRSSQVKGQGGDLTVIGSLEEWNSNPSKIVELAGESVAVFKGPLGFRACQNTCPHAGGSLGEGLVQGDEVTCPLHGWQFDLKTGACLDGSGNDIKIYDVQVKEGKVGIKS